MGSGSPNGSGTMRNDRRTVFGWAMYDFANSAYTTTTLAVVLPASVRSDIVPEGGVNILGRTFDAESLFSLLVAVTALIAFVGSPVLGAIGDYSASKRRFLQIFAYAGALLSPLLLRALPGRGAHHGPVPDSRDLLGDCGRLLRQLPPPHLDCRHHRSGLVAGIRLRVSRGGPSSPSPGPYPTGPSIGIDDGLAARLAMVMAGLGGWGSTSHARLREPTGPESTTTTKGFLEYVRLGFSRTWQTARRLGGFPHTSCSSSSPSSHTTTACRRSSPFPASTPPRPWVWPWAKWPSPSSLSKWSPSWERCSAGWPPGSESSGPSFSHW